jgi:hypothetical protein
MSNPDPNAAREIIQMLHERATEKEEMLALAKRLKSSIYIGSEFAADAKRLARYVISDIEGV